MSACMGGTRCSGDLSSAGDVLEMSVVRGVGGVCDMCMCLARGGVANRVIKRNKVLKTLAATNWGQPKETLLMTYKALGRSIANYVSPDWSTNARESTIGKIHRAQNEVSRIITGSHKMSSIDHLHNEIEMLQIEDHLKECSVR